jgi:hypothetical protein
LLGELAADDDEDGPRSKAAAPAED